MNNGRKISKRHQELMNCDSYLFSVEDAARLLRMSRVEFEKNYLGTKIPMVIKKKYVRGRLVDAKYVRHIHLKELIESEEVIYA